MVIIISKKFPKKHCTENSCFEEYKVEFDWLTNDIITIQTMCNNKCLSVNNQKAEMLDFALRYFNAGWGGNDRDTFKALLRCKNKSELSSIARVIGITNGLCHYFSNYSLNERSIGFLVSSIKEAKGFVFVDWDTVSVGGKNSNNQLIYLTNDDQELEYSDELKKMYGLGYSGLITITDERQLQVSCYYFESKDLNNPQARQFSCVKSIISTINSTLSNKLK